MRAGPSNTLPIVLIVDDEILTQTAAKEIVEAAGFVAIGVSNADEAVRVLEARRDVRAVFTDVQMPGSMDGLGLARLVKSRWPGVALLVTSGRLHLHERDLPEGGKFVPKPYTASRIEATLRALLGD